MRFRYKKVIIGVALLLLYSSLFAFASVRVHFSFISDPEKAIITELSDAKESMDIAMYYFTDRELAMAVIDAYNRGVRVRIYLDKGQREYKYSKSRYLEENDITIRYSDNPYIMHHKFCVIDNKVLITGSYNWTGAAGEKNNENLLIIDDVKVVQEYLLEFNRLWSRHYLSAKELKPTNISLIPTQESFVVYP